MDQGESFLGQRRGPRPARHPGYAALVVALAVFWWTWLLVIHAHPHLAVQLRVQATVQGAALSRDQAERLFARLAARGTQMLRSGRLDQAEVKAALHPSRTDRALLQIELTCDDPRLAEKRLKQLLDHWRHGPMELETALVRQRRLLEQRVREAQQRENRLAYEMQNLLETLRSQLESVAQSPPDGSSDRERDIQQVRRKLEQLSLERDLLLGTLQPEHPQVVRLQMEIDQLQRIQEQLEENGQARPTKRVAALPAGYRDPVEGDQSWTALQRHAIGQIAQQITDIQYRYWDARDRRLAAQQAYWQLLADWRPPRLRLRPLGPPRYSMANPRAVRTALWLSLGLALAAGTAWAVVGQRWGRTVFWSREGLERALPAGTVIWAGSAPRWHLRRLLATATTLTPRIAEIALFIGLVLLLAVALGALAQDQPPSNWLWWVALHLWNA